MDQEVMAENPVGRTLNSSRALFECSRMAIGYKIEGMTWDSDPTTVVELKIESEVEAGRQQGAVYGKPDIGLEVELG